MTFVPKMLFFGLFKSVETLRNLPIDFQSRRPVRRRGPRLLLLPDSRNVFNPYNEDDHEDDTDDEAMDTHFVEDDNQDDEMDESENACSICMQHKKKYAFACGHLFCKTCSTRVLQQERCECPTCRTPIVQRTRIRVFL
ncbi:MAG: RING-HC finger protein [Pontimonas sp.]